ncbi:MAG TPA: hypothetical protein VJ323_14085 [Bryobacteraceae bacterium]|jgi:hypothetical protein|nr:hypothetical protein [Bryobacteraceae bacterium]
MPLQRTVVQQENAFSYIASLFTETAFASPWSHPNVPVLVFADSILPGFSVQHHGGPVGSGTPVQLLFWGDWWNSPAGITRRDLITTRVQAVLASDYFSELKQYGINRPHWRGSLVVTKPGPPGAFNSNGDVQAVPDLIDDLIDDDVFPDPDDEQIAFVVFMPAGFTQSIGANGSHTKDYDYEFPFDKDWFWVAWVRSFGDTPGEDPEDAIRTFSHELVEMLSDPEVDGWYAGDPSTGEIGDAAVSGNVKQTAWVNGAHVQAYWSNQYGATVIPIDRDYQARINGTSRLVKRNVVSGTFRADPADTRLCSLLPQCCLDDRDYKFTRVERDEVVRLSVETQRYRQPQITWSVQGVAVTGNGVLSLDVIAGTFEQQNGKFGPRTVAVQCNLSDSQLTLSTVGTGANFDVTVSCTVIDASITGNVKTNVIAKPALTVGFVGVEVTKEDIYEKQRAACKEAAKKMIDAANRPRVRKAKLGTPVEFGEAILSRVPTYARLHEFQNARRVVDMARLAVTVLPMENAQLLTASLVADVPGLQAALAVESTNAYVNSDRSCEAADQDPLEPVALK